MKLTMVIKGSKSKLIFFFLLFSSLLLIFIILFRNDFNLFSNNNVSLVNDTIPLTKPWETPIPHQIIPKGLTSLSAKSCGACHREIYEEWKESTHAVAFQDMQFQAELKKDNILTCLNCHTPLQNQLKYIVSGFINGDYKKPVKKLNPNYDKKLQLESITCAACHVRNGKVIGAVGYENTPHETEKNPKFLNESLCIKCHNAVDKINATLVCTFETGDEWNSNWAKKEGKNCISCHMQSINRSIFSGYPIRKSHYHAFPGSGIPKFFGKKTNRLESLVFETSDLNRSYLINDTLKFKFSLMNKEAGHNVPTGDPERFIITKFSIYNSFNEIVYSQEHRIGEKWKWYPEVEKLDDNNLKPNEKRTYSLIYKILKKGNYKIVVEVYKHRINEENAKYNKILGKYPLFINVYKKEFEFVVN